jgi:hypothetical protein
MPNIIEQQDLLKGLPDARLAMLLQNPVGDIPPFLVAAEAQRRQAIRQQFASEASQESVVDTLTKQIANVPQNVNAPTRTPPMVPPTPPMQGVMALQQQQAMADIAQQAQPQMMRGGGMVQRYQSQGLVQRMAERYGNRAPTVQELAGMTPEELTALRKYQSDERMARLNQRAQITGGRYGQGIAYQRELLENRLEGPFAEFASPESAVEAAKRLQQLPTEEGMNQTLEGMTPEEFVNFNESVALPNVAVGGKQPAPPKPRPRPDNLPKPEPGETEDQFRARLEALYASPELSDWEKAQRWFAMSEQFLDPSKTTMQSIAGAGQAFAQSAAEQARAQRDAELAREKAMLEYDMSLAAERRAAAQAERERTTFSAKDQADILVKRQESLSRLITSKKEALLKLADDPLAAKVDPTITSRIAALQEEIAADEERLRQVEGALSSLGEMAYGSIPFDTYSLSSGFKI